MLNDLTKYHETTRTVTFDYSSELNISFEEIQEVLYLWKKSYTNENESFLVKRYVKDALDNTLNVDDALKQFSIEITEDDYEKVTLNTQYQEVIAIKKTGKTKFKSFLLKSVNNNSLSLIRIVPNWAQI